MQPGEQVIAAGFEVQGPGGAAPARETRINVCMGVHRISRHPVGALLDEWGR